VTETIAGMDIPDSQMVREATELVDAVTAEEIAAVVTAHPRAGFTDDILHAYYTGIKDRPATNVGTINHDIQAYFDPKFCQMNLVNLIRHNNLQH
jgi:hypothetical protein